MASTRIIKYVAAGLRTDTDRLLQEFVAEKTTTFLNFSKIWKRFCFSLIYLGRENEKELREFTEEAFRIALSYLIPVNTFPLKLGAIYLIYGLFVKQPFLPNTKVRIKLDQWKEVKSVLDVAIKEKHMDMFYVIHKLLELSAFHFVSQTTMLGPRASVSGEPEVTWRCNRLQDLMNPLHTLVEDGYIEQLATMHEQYQKMKSCQDISHIKNLHMVHDDLSVDFAMKIKTLFDRYRDSSSTDNAGEDYLAADVGKRRALLKEKQYQSQAAVLRSRRHRSTVIEVPVAEVNQVVSSSPVKRGRGRPRKAETETVKKSARGRGRPRGRPRGSGKNQQMTREIRALLEVDDSVDADVDGALGLDNEMESQKLRRRAPKPRKTRYHYAD